jgi:penicillin-binding protein 2
MKRTQRLKDHWAEQRLFMRRIVASSVIVVLLTGVVLGRLAQLQLVDHEYFSAQSQGNRIRVQPLPPTRGLIYDRRGRIIAENLPTYQLELIPEEVPDIPQTLTSLEAIGLLDPQNRPDIEELISSHRRFDAIALRQRLTDTDVARFAVQRPRFPGVDIRARLTRNYPNGAVAAHALGYVGGISASDADTLDPARYAGTAFIGKTSVERAYEDLLHGEVGHTQVLVNAYGRVMQDLGGEPSLPGRDIYLTIDIDVQIAAEQALADRRGAIVAIDPRDGSIIALASQPAFDPNAFSGGLSRADYAALRDDEDRPLFNRAVRGTYPPGSTVKPILALAALRHGVMDPDEKMFCRGFYSLPGNRHRYRDWKREGHGPVDMHDAIAQSCDVYYYEMARMLDIDRMHPVLEEFGLGAATGIDIPGERTGLVPSRAWKRTAFAAREDQVWFPGETVIAGIGQGYMLTTPLQLAHATATVAMRGARYQPALMYAVVNPVDGQAVLREPVALPAVSEVSDEDWQRIVGGMEEVVHGERGTARAIGRRAPWRIAGKSGTAQVFGIAQDEEYDEEELEERLRDHALFIAFAPVEDPRISVAVVVENGGSGSSVAAPMARSVIDAWLGSEPE